MEIVLLYQNKCRSIYLVLGNVKCHNLDIIITVLLKILVVEAFLNLWICRTHKVKQARRSTIVIYILQI